MVSISLATLSGALLIFLDSYNRIVRTGEIRVPNPNPSARRPGTGQTNGEDSDSDDSVPFHVLRERKFVDAWFRNVVVNVTVSSKTGRLDDRSHTVDSGGDDRSPSGGSSSPPSPPEGSVVSPNQAPRETVTQLLPKFLVHQREWIAFIRNISLQGTKWIGYDPFCRDPVCVSNNCCAKNPFQLMKTGGPEFAGAERVAYEEVSTSKTGADVLVQRPETRIPKIIHKIFLLPEDAAYNISRADLPDRVQAAMASWEGVFNLGYTVKFWNEYLIRQFIRREYGSENLDAYDTIIPESWRSDFARFSIVNKLGGWYTDILTVLLKPIDEYLRVDCELRDEEETPIFFCDRLENTLQAAMFRAPPGHPWLVRALEAVKKFALSKTYGTNALMTGPLALGTAAKVEGMCQRFGEGSLDLAKWKRPRMGYFVNHQGQNKGYGNGFALTKIGALPQPGVKDPFNPFILYKFTYLTHALPPADRSPYPENNYARLFFDKTAYREEGERVERQRRLPVI